MIFSYVYSNSLVYFTSLKVVLGTYRFSIYFRCSSPVSLNISSTVTTALRLLRFWVSFKCLHVFLIAGIADLRLWLAHITKFTFSFSQVPIGVFSAYLVGTIITGNLLSHTYSHSFISSKVSFLLWIKIASAPAYLYFSALYKASLTPLPEINDSHLATITKLASIFES